MLTFLCLPPSCFAFKQKARTHGVWIPDMSSERMVPRLRCPSLQHFRKHFLAPGRPVVLEGVVDQWPCMQKWRWVAVRAGKCSLAHAPRPAPAGAAEVEQEGGAPGSRRGRETHALLGWPARSGCCSGHLAAVQPYVCSGHRAGCEQLRGPCQGPGGLKAEVRTQDTSPPSWGGSWACSLLTPASGPPPLPIHGCEGGSGRWPVALMPAEMSSRGL